MPVSSAAANAEDRLIHPPRSPCRDYILTDYAPAGPIHQASLQSVSVLRWFLRHHGLFDLAWPVVERAVALLGPAETVWGAKLVRGEPALELYFYNRDPEARVNPKSITRLVAGLAPVIAIDSRIDERVPYFMCSLELDIPALRARRSDGFRAYVAGQPGLGADGVSYHVRGSALVIENSYAFFRGSTAPAEVRAHMAASIRSGLPPAYERLLPAPLTDCYTICHAIKRHTDALYFSRVSTTGLAWFLAEHWPGEFPTRVAADASALAHLRWDVGYDYAASSESPTPNLAKVGFYGFC